MFTDTSDRPSRVCKRNSHPLYYRWKSMRNRCNNPNNKWYADYGGRGITICPEWNDFYAYAEDMGLPPFPNASIDRIDNDGPYSPENCRWATKQEQVLNQRLRKDADLDSWWRKNKVPINETNKEAE